MQVYAMIWQELLHGLPGYSHEKDVNSNIQSGHVVLARVFVESFRPTRGLRKGFCEHCRVTRVHMRLVDDASLVKRL